MLEYALLLMLQSAVSSSSFAQGMGLLAAGLAFGLAAVGAGIAMARIGSSGLAATAEKPELRTWSIVILAFGETIAIYGIAIAILMLGRLPS
ncbi:MAG: ATP synthase subunit C [Nitrososphaeria archaeon]|jgi:V/A-type H+-transporting ATPase subunit K